MVQVAEGERGEAGPEPLSVLLPKFRVSASMADRIKRHMEALVAETRVDVDRTQVLRALLGRGLDAVEAEAAAKAEAAKGTAGT